jgi:Trypsin-like serine proteases, typically periplasmic, contain C-terminal PDZ domain
MNRKLKDILTIVGISAVTTLAVVWGYGKWMQSRYAGLQDPTKLPVNYAGFFGKAANGDAINFEAPATAATPAVVHIKTKTKARTISNGSSKRSNPFGDLFGDDFFGDLFNGPRIIPEQQASGSGVIISPDGYIVTCNHVVANADEIKITLANKKTYTASIVGTDPSSDLAVIKIDADNLPYIVYGNSDNSKLGQWVLAIGYPLNLDVSVTAGIISAKARSIGINRQDGEVKNAVESFIQTDAAVNPGNSGGALINTNGELIGITSAIASQTGYYSGVSYAIPVNIVKKVATDIIKYGMVQRAYIGIQYAPDEASDEEKKQAGVKEGDGVYVLSVPDGAAKEAGIKKGDFITKINGVKVSSGAEMVEQVSRYKPGDKITVTYSRNGNENTVNLVLKNKSNTTSVVKYESSLDKIGASFENIDKKTANANQINGGVVVKKIQQGSAFQKARIQEGFIITSVNGSEISSVDDLKDALRNAHGTLFLEGIYPGDTMSYRYPVKIDGED